MTSLAKQLQRLAVPHTQSILGEDYRKESLLFDPKEAAGIDRDTFHAIGVNGLEELGNIDEEFFEFEKSLFGDSSLTFERSVQTQAVNTKLDETISQFLINLSPYCMLKPAHKALEWLIHRFHIHFYNTDDLLMCFLPYHESKIFVRVLQLLKLKSKTASKWDWLLPSQKSGIHLSRSTLVNHCRTNPAFLSFICNAVPKAVKVIADVQRASQKCRVLFSFYTTTVVSVLENADITEELVSALLPHVSLGLQSKIPDYKAASYMILAQILHRTKLKANILKAVQKIVAKHLSVDLMTEGVTCLLLMFQTQDMTTVKLSKASFKYLSSYSTMIEALAHLSEQFESTKFLQCLLNRLIPAAFKQAVGMATSGESSESESGRSLPSFMNMLHRLLSSIELPDDIAEQAALQFLQTYVSHGNYCLEKDDEDRLKESLQGIVRLLEGKYSSKVDIAVQAVLKESPTDEGKKLVQDFLNLYVLSVPKQLVEESDTNIVLSLNHRLDIVRERAVQTLLQNKDKVDDQEFLRDSLRQRLKDECPQVVLKVLELGKELWFVMGNEEETISLLVKVALKALEKQAWRPVGLKSVQILFGYSGECEMEIVTGLLPYFYFTVSSEKLLQEALELISSSDLASKNKMLKRTMNAWKKIVKKEEAAIGELNVSMATCLAEGLLGYSKEEYQQMVSQWVRQSVVTSHPTIPCLLLLVIDSLVSKVTDKCQKIKLCLSQVQLVETVLRGKPDKYAKLQEGMLSADWSVLLTKHATHLSVGKVPQVFCGKALNCLIQYFSGMDNLHPGNKMLEFKDDKSLSDYHIALMVRMFGLLLNRSSDGHKSCPAYQTLFAQLIQTWFSTPVSLMKFLALLWTQHENDHASDLGLTSVLQVHALKIGLVHMQKYDSASLTELLESPSPVIVSLLVTLTSPYVEVRKLTMNCLKELFSKMEDVGSDFTALLKKIVRCQEEVEADPDYIKQVVQSVFLKCGMEPTTPKRKTRKSSLQLSPKQQCFKALMGVITDDSPIYMQRALLNVFSLLNTETFLQGILPLMKKLLSRQRKDFLLSEVDCLNAITRQFTVETAGILTEKSQGLMLFLTALKLYNECTSASGPSIQMVVLGQVTKQLYEAVGDTVQRSILSSLFDVWVDTNELMVANTVRRVIRHLSLNASHIEEELKTCLKLPTPKTVRESKKLKRDPKEQGEGAELEFDSPLWQRVTVVLEALQNKKKIHNYTALVSTCFQVLSRVLESDNHVSGEYLKQLLLSVLYNLCTRMETDKEDPDAERIPEGHFNMELIVNCIRSSDNPQTHHQALLLLTSAATIFPEHLLHNMMSVFTFMGASILRQDDAYSFQIIGRILETVIPSLITACKQRKRVPKEITNNQEDIITMVIQVFVDAYPHIPEHRRHVLFTKLITVIGEDSYLWRTLLLMMGLVVTKGTLKAELATDSQETQGGLPPRDIEFCLGLCAEFPAVVQLAAAREMLLYIAKLPDHKDDDDKRRLKSFPQSLGKLRKEDVAIFSVDLHTAKQLRHFKYGTVHLLVTLFSGTDFITQFAKNEDRDILQNFQGVLATVLQYITLVTKATNQFSDKPTAKFWRALQHKTYDLLDKLVNLLPDSMFVEVITGLVSHDHPSIQRKAMELLNIKLQQQQKDNLQDEEVSQLLLVVTHLHDLVGKLKTKPEGEIIEEESINCQTAFISLKLLCRTIGSHHTEQFVEVLKTTIEVFSHCQTNHQVAACALLCIAEICNALKVHVIQHLPSFMPKIIDILKDEERLLENELFLLSIVTTLSKVVENMTHFLSPYLLDILFHVSSLSGMAERVESLQKQQVQLKLKSIKNILSTYLPTRVLLPAVTTCFLQLQEDKLFCISSLLTILRGHISNLKKDNLSSHVTQLQTFFLTCLDLRLDHPELTPKEINKLEDSAIETLITLVMKLSEATFKPFLFKLYDWATSSEEHRERVLVFYRLADKLAEKLKSLFCLFAGHFVNHAAKMLDQNNKSKQVTRFFALDKKKRKKSNLLLVHLVDCLQKCFLYDSEGFVTKERFETLMQPLVDQLENQQGSESTYQDRVENHLVPCIVQMALAAQDDSLWRVLSYQICLKTRHSEPEVRCAGLKALDALHKKLGEDYLNLLPETIPFLAELMEDESEEVEKLCQSVIADMEKTLGEPLQKYF